jgi:hypothetical protein
LIQNWTARILPAVLAAPLLLAGCGEDVAQEVLPPPTNSNEAIMRYAPRIYLAADELQGGQSYRPSSVEWFLANVDRVEIEGQYWTQTKVPLTHATEVQPFFYGPEDEDLDEVPTYAFWIESQDVWRGHADIVYFFFYPYNRGKDMVQSVWGNHVGDWEHVTVRIDSTTFEPLELALSAHAGGETIKWDDIEKTADGHPIAYAAWGSHANYSTPGAHIYNTIEVPPLDDIEITDLTSSASDGVAWDTWNKIEAFDFYTQQGLDGATWPGWMSTEFADASSEAIYRWGNTEDTCGLCLGSLCWDFPDICLLENGPTGPVSKGSVWDLDVLD